MEMSLNGLVLRWQKNIAHSDSLFIYPVYIRGHVFIYLELQLSFPVRLPPGRSPLWLDRWKRCDDSVHV